jgi:hypothetical protein
MYNSVVPSEAGWKDRFGPAPSLHPRGWSQTIVTLWKVRMNKNFGFTIPWFNLEKPTVLIGDDDRQFVLTITMPPKRYRSICRIELDRSPLDNATGFLVAPNWMLTCNHVLGSKAEALGARITVGLVRTWSFGRLRVTRTRPTEFAAKPGVGFYSSPPPCPPDEVLSDRLDYTLVYVEAKSSSALIPHFLPVSQADGRVHEAVKIYQFPTNSMKVASGSLTEVTTLAFKHNADTEGGASGSPVVGPDGQAFGIHRRGFYKPNLINTGTLLTEIFKDVHQQSLDVWTHIAEHQDWFIG